MDCKLYWDQTKSFTLLEYMIIWCEIQLIIIHCFSPDTPGSGYVLLHHVMGELEGIRGAWGYPEGGMGAVSRNIFIYLMIIGQCTIN